jgi:hypothetical protein
MNGSNDGVPYFWGRRVNSLYFDTLTIGDTGNAGAGQSAKVFDLVGGAATSALNCSQVVIVDVADLGEISDMILSFRPTTNFVSPGRGLAHDTSQGTITPNPHALNGWRFINPFMIATNGPYLGFTGTQSTLNCTTGSTEFTTSDEAFRIDGETVGNFTFSANVFDGSGEFLSEGNTAAITAYAMEDIGVSGFADSSADPGVDTTVNLTAATQFKTGQLVLIAEEPAYNGEHAIVRVADDQLSFDINVVFSTNDAAVLKQTRITSASHGFILNENMTISGSTNYNVPHRINQIIDNDTYEIPFAFVANDATGTADSVSKTQKDTGIESISNGEAPDSKRLAFGFINGNATLTSGFVADVYQNINFGASIQDDIITERFELTDATNGVYTYRDPRPITVKVEGTMWIVKTGATQSYRFSLNTDGATPAFTTSITSVTDSSGIARFNFTPGPTVFVGQTLTIKDFVTNTDYNGEIIIDTVGAGFFESNEIAFGTNEAVGSFESKYAPVEVKTTQEIAQFSEFVEIVEDDTLQIMIAADGHTDSATVTDAKIALSEA